jgi:hypothetical protein
MESLLIKPKTKKQLSLVKTLLNALNVPFYNESLENRVFYPELDKKIKAARKEKDEDKLVTIDLKNLWDSK